MADTRENDASPEVPLAPLLQRYLDGIDRSLLRKNLELSVEQRFLQLMALQRFADELRRAGRAISEP